MPRRHPLLLPVILVSAALSSGPATPITRAQGLERPGAFRLAIHEELPAERAVRFALRGDELVIGSEVEATRGMRVVTLTGLATGLITQRVGSTRPPRLRTSEKLITRTNKTRSL